jgi:hypothetical protein
MDIYIDEIWIDVDPDHCHRVLTRDLETSESLANCVLHHLVTYWPAVEKCPDPIGVSALEIWPGDPACHPFTAVDLDHPGRDFGPEHLCNALVQ